MIRKLLQIFWFSVLLMNSPIPLHASAAEDSKPASSAHSPRSKNLVSKESKSTTVKTTTVKTTKAKLAAPITEARAVAIVSARPEVKKFLQDIKNTKIKGAASHIEFDRKEGSDLVVHVYEYVPDDAGTGHTATFNWYHVNLKTGKVSTEF